MGTFCLLKTALEKGRNPQINLLPYYGMLDVKKKKEAALEWFNNTHA